MPIHSGTPTTSPATPMVCAPERIGHSVWFYQAQATEHECFTHLVPCATTVDVVSGDNAGLGALAHGENL
ncbi:hypothetical protein E2C01_001350 [Portunus trituberculatus]|uniref:Uncharacterized protein n=1 Tax=Portunus trituberculatus TaxID=210409 RepID=A0A5B7CK74_PORTR|nr:hypothetical protein [Portunus trituberculatus]